MTTAVGWFEIYVNDMNSAKKFYEDVFKTTLEPLAHSGTETGGSASMEMYGFPHTPDQPGSGGALVYMEGMRAGGNSVIVYFSCKDCVVEEERAVKAGGKVFKPKSPIPPYGYISLIFDNQGNMIGLHSMT